MWCSEDETLLDMDLVKRHAYKKALQMVFLCLPLCWVICIYSASISGEGFYA